MCSTNKLTFESVVLEHGQFIRRTLAQLGVAAKDLPDVEQEVFRGIDKGLPTFDPVLAANPATALRGWLFGICERQAANHRRSENRRGEVLRTNEELDIAISAAPDVEEKLLAAERKAILSELLATLEPQRRAVVVAYELEGLPMQEVATAMSIPVNTAWNRLRLAREDLKAAWRRMDAQRRYVLGLPLTGIGAGDAETTLRHLLASARPADALPPPTDVPPPPRAAAARTPPAPPPPAPPAVPPAAPVAPLAPSSVGKLLLGAGLREGVRSAVTLPFVHVMSIGSGLVLAGAIAGASIRAVITSPPPPPPRSAMVAAATPASSLQPAAPASSDVAALDPRDARDAPPADPATLMEPHDSPSELLSSSEPGVDSGVGVDTSSAGKALPSLDVSLKRERDVINQGVSALARGDLFAAHNAVELHLKTYPRGRLMSDRENLFVQLLSREGRDAEAKRRAQRALDADPAPARRETLEAVVGKLD